MSVRELIAAASELEALEAAACADPGIELDHDHQETVATRRYDEAWTAVREHVGGLEPFTGWHEGDSWCVANRHRFGWVEAPGLHGGRMLWIEDARSVRSLLVDAAVQRASLRNVTPKDAARWKAAAMQALLRAWCEDAALPAHSRAFVLAAIPEAEAIAKTVRAGALHEQLERTRASIERFDATSLAFAPATGGVVAIVAFAEMLEREERVRLELRTVEKDDLLAEATLVRPKAGTLAVRKEWDWDGNVTLRGSELAFVIERSDLARVNAKGKKLDKLDPEQAIALRVSNPGIPGRTLLHARVGEAGAVAASKSGARCRRCGDETPVLLERLGGECPACVEGIPSDRPPQGADLDRLLTVRERWADVACPSCKGRVFRSPFPFISQARRDSRTRERFACTKCPERIRMLASGMQIDPARAIDGIAAPSAGWRELLVLDRALSTGGLNHGERLAAITSVQRDVSRAADPAWRELALCTADALEDSWTGVPLFDDEVAEEVRTVGGPAVDAAQLLRKSLGA